MHMIHQHTCRQDIHIHKIIRKCNGHILKCTLRTADIISKSLYIVNIHLIKFLGLVLTTYLKCRKAMMPLSVTFPQAIISNFNRLFCKFSS